MAEHKLDCNRAADYAIGELSRVGHVSKLTPCVRTVLMVHAAQGIIDNGGLQYFFENDWDGQPNYSDFVDAYAAIGASTEAQAIESAVLLFPFADPHKFQNLRREFLERFQDGGGHRADSPFEPFSDQICGSERVWQLLEKYVQVHGDSFPT